MIRGHGGNIYDLARNIGCTPTDITDMSNNTNPLGPIPELLEHLKENMSAVAVHPEVDAKRLVELFASHYRIGADRAIAGNGTTQFIFASPLALETKKSLIVGPTYADYSDACQMYKIDCEYVMAKESKLFQPDVEDIRGCLKDMDTVFICNPNNPTGNLIPRGDLVDLCETYPKTRFLIDESYLPFTKNYHETTMIQAGLSNLVVLQSFSKVFRIPGLRLGFLIASPKIIGQFRYFYQPWSVNSLAQVAGIFLLEHVLVDDTFIKETQAFIASEKRLLAGRLKAVSSLTLFPSMASFMLIKIKEHLNAAQLCSIMAQNRVLLRNCSNFKGLSDRFVRIALKSPEINARVADTFREIFA
ncbi:MAG: pyridoxal phosphate-dependent class II aminotransferase [Deltaproteobacteria bacterium]|nr:pyridoxal phosphate-dependent class II aminotransferase [Deltaproteobacteria bacterium]MBW2340849.1 pyridoxal phosphate-dependent class II aminotransferase [Deltaproteobacteria bacterium]